MMQLDPSILDDLAVPDGLDKTVLCDNIVLECAELEVLYTDAEFLKTAIAVWSVKELPTWKRLLAAMEATYNPIENYNRIENWSESSSGNKDVSSSSSGTGTTTNGNTTTDKVTGYDSDQQKTRGSSEYSGTGETTSSSSGTGSETHADTMLHQGQIRGNIGTTTSQQMLREEIEIAPALNLYNKITADFKRRFCLLIYT